MQKRKKGNSNLTVTQITNVHKLMVQKLSNHLLHLLLKKLSLVARFFIDNVIEVYLSRKWTRVQYESAKTIVRKINSVCMFRGCYFQHSRKRI